MSDDRDFRDGREDERYWSEGYPSHGDDSSAAGWVFVLIVVLLVIIIGGVSFGVMYAADVVAQAMGWR